MKRLVATLLLVSWAWALLLAGMPELHEWAHGVAHERCEHHDHDGGEDEEDHECAVTLITTGALALAHAAPIHAGDPIVFAEVKWTWRSSDVASLELVSGSHERGPPVSGV